MDRLDKYAMQNGHGMNRPKEAHGYDVLLEQYLKICNEALEINKDRFPYKQILGAAQMAEIPKNIEVCVIDDHPDASYVFHVEDHKITGETHPDCTHCSCDQRWRVTKSYLQDVVDNPQTYIDNPAKIDWEWLVKDND